MTKRVTSLVLSILMLLQILVPQTTIAKEVEAPPDNLVTVGLINGNSYDSKLMLELNRLTAKNRKKKAADPGTSLFGYFENDQEPKDEDKLKYHGEVKAKLDVKGLDGNNFQWSEIFGKEEVHLRFTQINDETGDDTGIERVLTISQAGTYIWTNENGEPAELPLFNNKLKPLTYEVKLDEEVSDKVKLLTARLATTGDANTPTFEKPDAEGRIKYHLTLEIGLQQVASSKFVSEWHTAVAKNERPQIKGTMTGSYNSKSKAATFDLPKNDTDSVVIRTNSPREGRKPGKIFANFLYNKPSDIKVKTDTTGLTFDTTKKTVDDGNHKFRYDFTYDVINGGKLTMTEILPVTFDANGGKFASITEEGAEQKIVKEVEYEGTLTDKAENPTKDRETFKGWSLTKDGKDPVTDADFANIKKAKTFYAIWDNNEITAEELEVKESFKDGDTWVNDSIPTLDQLKGQVKIKDAKGKPQALADDDTFAIVDGANEYTADGDALKNYLYGKLQEKDNPKDEPTRVETVKAKVTHANGTSQTVDIPIKVIKNIYEAKTETKPPFYVPDNYVKVILDPTTKAKDPQKTYYYVNPAAKVVILGKDPVGTGDNKFVKWTMKADDATGEGSEYKLADKPRTQFEKASTITAQYVSDVIPANDDGSKPDTVPKNFVEVKFVPTDKATDETKAEKIFWVNPDKKVTIPVKDPVGKQYFTFKEWKIGVNADGDVYTPSTAKKFTEATTITATYTESDNIIPFDPTNLDDPKVVRPEGYVKITFEAEKGLKLTESKAYYVKANAKDTQGNPLTLGNADLVKPQYSEDTGYKFDKWDKEDSLVIEATDIVVTAKATKLDNVIPEKTGETPNEKPDGYKEVTFVIKSDDATKGSIEGVAKFYVNPTAYVTINPPATKAETGYEFGTWDKNTLNNIQYKEDTTITGSFNDLEAVIPKTNPDGKENKQPDGYKKVEFVIDPAEGGKIADKEVTIYYVNPAKEVTVPQPKTAADTGYTFEKWDKDTSTAKKYTDDTTVKGNFKKLDDIIPSTDDKGNTNAKPDGYVTVTFDKGAKGKSIKGQTVYYVNPKADPAKTLGDTKIVKPEVKAETGYKFTSWNFADTKEILSDITVVAQYEEIADVIPKTKDDGTQNEKPDGYIEVTFSTESNGKIKNSTDTTKVVYVNPNKAVALKDFAPKVDPNTGFDFADWDTSIERAIQYKDKDVIKAKYNVKGDVIPQEKADGSDKPEGYLTVTFDKGENGTLSGTTVYYVKPNKKVTVPAPDVKPNVGYVFDKWDKELTQTFAEDTKITSGYKPLDNIIPQKNNDGTDKPYGYVTVTFKADENGTLSGTTVYYVKPKVDIDLTNTANVITKEANIGYTADGGTWDHKLGPKTYTEKATYKFNFAKLDDIIPRDKTNEIPKGYKTVKFVTDDNGSLDGKTVYYVNPNAKKTMSDINAPTIKPNSGFVVKTPNWNPDSDRYGDIIKEDRVYAANYDKLCTTKIRYKSNDESMGTVSLASEDITSENLKGSTATAKDGYEFVKWTDIDGKEVGKNPTFKPKEKVAAVYIAVFKKKATDISKDGSLTITKKLENDKKITTSEPTKFKFEVSGPNKYNKVFELKAGSSETLKDLAYGDYKVKETDSQGYTAYYALNGGKESQANEYTVTINSASPAKLIVTNKKENPTNPDDKKINVISKKVWVGVPNGTKTPNVKFQLYRKLENSTEEETVGEAKDLVNNEVNFGEQDKKDKNGKAYYYFVKELNEDGTPFSNPNYTSKVDGLTVTNTYKTPEVEEKFVNVVAYKKWVNVPDGAEKPSVKFQLRRISNDDTSENVVETKDVLGEPDGRGLITVDFGQQKEFNDKGYRYSYYVVELDVNGNVINNGALYEATENNNIKTTYDLENMIVTNAYVGKDEEITPGVTPPVPTPDPTPRPEPEPTPEPGPNPKPNPQPNPNPNPGESGGQIPTPTPTPTPQPDLKPNPQPDQRVKPNKKPGSDSNNRFGNNKVKKTPKTGVEDATFATYALAISSALLGIFVKKKRNKIKN